MNQIYLYTNFGIISRLQKQEDTCKFSPMGPGKVLCYNKFLLYQCSLFFNVNLSTFNIHEPFWVNLNSSVQGIVTRVKPSEGEGVWSHPHFGCEDPFLSFLTFFSFRTPPFFFAGQMGVIASPPPPLESEDRFLSDFLFLFTPPPFPNSLRQAWGVMLKLLSRLS